MVAVLVILPSAIGDIMMASPLLLTLHNTHLPPMTSHNA